MKKYSFKERFQYWFDNQMAKGTRSMIIMLAVATVIIASIVSIVVFLVCREDELSLFGAFWDSIATIINAWMPYSSDGSPKYLILTAFVALVGLLFTSVLIGIVSSSIEERLAGLRKGTSKVLESGHIVVLGFIPGEYMLISQLVKAAADTPRCIVVADAMEKDEMESGIRDNIEIPKNVRIVCRNIDICDPVALGCCSISESRVILVNSTNDARTIHTILAVQKLLSSTDARTRIPIIAAISDRNYTLPAFTTDGGKTVLIHTASLISRVIAHSATHMGLASAFTEVFGFDGSEFYAGEFPALYGKTFLEIMDCSRGGVPIGVVRAKESILIPKPDEVFGSGDRLLYFAESRTDITFNNSDVPNASNLILNDESDGNVLILGNNDNLPLIMSELPDDISEVKVVEDVVLSELEEQIEGADHIILLSNPSVPEDEADMRSIMTLLQLQDIRARRQAGFNITVEMKNEKEHNLIPAGDTIDFVVASDTTAMVLAQIAENLELKDVFNELLSNDGCEFYVKKLTSANVAGTMTIGEIRHNLFLMKHIMLGYITELDGKIQIILNPSEKEELRLDGSVNLIVINE